MREVARRARETVRRAMSVDSMQALSAESKVSGKILNSPFSGFRLEKLQDPAMRISQASPIILLVPALLSAAGTTTTLSSSANPAEYGHAVTLTAAVTPATATGKVTFYDGTTVLETETLVSGKAVFTTTLLTSGAQSLKAHYEGDPSDAPSTLAILTEQVNTVSGNGFQLPVTFPVELTPYLAGAADFNSDGKADLVVLDSNENSNSVPDSVSVLLGNGDGTFQPAANYAVGYHSGTVLIADFNGDGKMDFAVNNEDPSVVYIFLGNGDGTFQAPTSYTGFPYAYFIATADFNGDGVPDLFAETTANSETTSLAMLALGNGDGTFQSASTIYDGPQFDLLIGDFNEDGKADLALFLDEYPNPAVISVLLGNGDGTFQSELNTGLPNNQAFDMAAADFNGDGKLDLAVSNNQVPERGPPYTIEYLSGERGRYVSASCQLHNR